VREVGAGPETTHGRLTQDCYNKSGMNFPKENAKDFLARLKDGGVSSDSSGRGRIAMVRAPQR